MRQITLHREIDAPRDLVWEVLTDHELYGEIAPNLSTVEVVAGEREGMVRRCVDADGNAWTETCHRWDEGHRFDVAVDVATSEFHRRLFDRFEGSWAVTEQTDGVRMTIRFEYETKYGPLGWLFSKFVEYRAPAIVATIFDGWTTEIESRLDARPDTGRPDDRGRTADASHRDTPNRLYR